MEENMAILPDLIMAIAATWSLYALLGTSFALSFRVAGFFDLSVGVSFLVGGYVAWMLSFFTTVILAAGFAVIISAIVAAAMGRWVITPLALRLPPLALLVSTLALLYIAQAIAAIAFGEAAVNIQRGEPAVIDFGFIRMTEKQLTLTFFAAAALGVLQIYLNTTPWGRFTRATADDKALSFLFGLPVTQTIFLNYSIGGALAGLAGVFFVMDRAIDPSQALSVLLVAMVAAMIGGRTIPATIGGALLLSALENVLGFILPGNWRTTAAFILLLTVIISKSGEFGQLPRRQM
jgi:neutral amino acid transport system permease protein